MRKKILCYCDFVRDDWETYFLKLNPNLLTSAGAHESIVLRISDTTGIGYDNAMVIRSHFRSTRCADFLWGSPSLLSTTEH